MVEAADTPGLSPRRLASGPRRRPSRGVSRRGRPAQGADQQSWPLAAEPAGRIQGHGTRSRRDLRRGGRGDGASDRGTKLLKPVTMSLFGMINWHYLWFEPARADQPQRICRTRVAADRGRHPRSGRPGLPSITPGDGGRIVNRQSISAPAAHLRDRGARRSPAECPGRGPRGGGPPPPPLPPGGAALSPWGEGRSARPARFIRGVTRDGVRTRRPPLSPRSGRGPREGASKKAPPPAPPPPLASLREARRLRRPSPPPRGEAERANRRHPAPSERKRL